MKNVIYSYIMCKGWPFLGNAYPECDKHVVGSVEDRHVRSGTEPWHHAMTQEPHCYNTFPPVISMRLIL